MKVFLLNKYNEIVGEAVIFSENYVLYHLFKDIRSTLQTTKKKLLKKYKTQVNLK